MLVWWPLSGFFHCQFVGRGRVLLRVLLRAANMRLLVRESRKSDADAGWMWSVRGGGGPLLAFFDGRFSDRDKGDSDQQ